MDDVNEVAEPQAVGDLMIDLMLGLTCILKGTSKPHELANTLVEISEHPEIGYVSNKANGLYNAVVSKWEDQ